MIRRCAALIALLLAAAPPAVAGGGGGDRYEWFALPLVGFDSDKGAGGAVSLVLFRNQPGVEPYRDKLFLDVSLTHKLVQSHSVTWERVGLLGEPLRLKAKLAFSANPVDNFCGFGNQASCSEVDQPDFYKVRYMRTRPKIDLVYQGFGLDGLWAQAGWRGVWNRSGFFGEDGPYPGSLYELTFPDGEDGFQSQVEVGLALERRDHERRPTRGFVLAAFLRGGHRLIGGDWDYGGGTLSATGYLPLDGGERLVWAARALADLLAGDPPSYEMGSVAGFNPGAAFGGSEIGRGVRLRRYIGRIKLIGQSELRWAVAGEPESFQFTAQALIDAAWIAVDWDRVGGDPGKVLTGFGGGIGGAWGRNLVVRIDAAVSPQEGYSPFFYALLSHPY